MRGHDLFFFDKTGRLFRTYKDTFSEISPCYFPLIVVALKTTEFYHLTLDSGKIFKRRTTWKRILEVLPCSPSGPFQILLLTEYQKNNKKVPGNFCRNWKKSAKIITIPKIIDFKENYNEKIKKNPGDGGRRKKNTNIFKSYCKSRINSILFRMTFLAENSLNGN